MPHNDIPTKLRSSLHCCRASALIEMATVKSSIPVRQRNSCWKMPASSPDTNMTLTDCRTWHVGIYAKSRMLRTSWAPIITVCNSFNKKAALFRWSSDRPSGKSLSEIMLITFLRTDRTPSSTCLPGCDADESSMCTSSTSPWQQHTCPVHINKLCFNILQLYFTTVTVWRWMPHSFA